MDLVSYEELEKLNFSVNEAKIYLALIHLGPSLAGTVAKEASVDRSSTYNALKLLIERGIVSTMHENKRTMYVPANPKKILDYYQEKEELAKKIIPGLQKQFAFRKQKSMMEFFQGYKGLKTVFQDILDTCEKGQDYVVFGSEGKFSQQMPFYQPLFSRLKAEKKIKTRILIREGRKKEERGQYTEFRQIPSDVISPATINIYGNKVAIFIWDDKPEAVLIENTDVAKTFKNYFNFMWNNAKSLDLPVRKST